MTAAETFPVSCMHPDQLSVLSELSVLRAPPPASQESIIIQVSFKENDGASTEVSLNGG